MLREATIGPHKYKAETAAREKKGKSKPTEDEGRTRLTTAAPLVHSREGKEAPQLCFGRIFLILYR